MSSDADPDVNAGDEYDDEDIDYVEWSRDWEWPAWLRAPSLRGWRLDPRTLALALAMGVAPFLFSSLWDLRRLVDRLFAITPDTFSPSLVVPTWVRIADGVGLFQVAAGAVIVAGGLIVFLGRTRLGAWLLAAGLALDASTHAVFVVAYILAGPVPTASMVGALASLGSRLVLLVATVLLLLRAPSTATGEEEEAALLPAG